MLERRSSIHPKFGNFPSFRMIINMSEFRFHLPIEVRYGDLDPQWHVNNARYLTFLEQGRMEYLRAMGLWDGEDFFNLGLIVADVHIAYLAPMFLGQKVRLDLRNEIHHHDHHDQERGATEVKRGAQLGPHDFRQ